MGYAVYEDRKARDYGVERWAGYGVPAKCDFPGCKKKIDRGFGYLCGEDVFQDNAGEHADNGDCLGCGLYFCTDHQFGNHQGIQPKPDSKEWVTWMLTDDSWARWREENTEQVAQMRDEVTH